MSEQNGDKARFGRERKHKILQRERARKSRELLEKTSPKKTPPELD